MRLNINTEKLLCQLLLIIIVLYFSQGVIIPMGIIGQILFILICTISIVFFFKLLISQTKFSNFIKFWLLFLFMNLLAYLLYGDLAEFTIIKITILNSLPLFAFYYFSEKNILTAKMIRKVFLVFLPIFIISFIQSISMLKIEVGKDDVIDNTIYLFIGLLPFVFFFKKKIFSFIFLLILWYFMVESAKRAAIICGIITIVLFFAHSIFASKGKVKIKHYIISISLFMAISYFAYEFYQENQFLIDRMQNMIEGDSSGRDNLVQKLWNTWYQSDDFFTYLFGFGYNSSMVITGHGSHNDWVDILASFGIIGFTVYLMYFIYFFLQIFNKNWSKDKRIVFILVFLIAVVTSLSSRWYWSSFSFMSMIILPYLLANKHKEI